ncbi:DUF445 domain-containing protein [Paenibacillus xerothermodurans]|uniref:DUF445 domain-containing protein n=1 Tax=Paenibacillus xerothermodurans TaxID=1977292 RepID=A0A2W1NWK6_PAEXE|nr:DUF445 domain-containing protein [Paenibacillus xerothermodurans]PZE22106.1 DUF445 domain-containing protein [Paenibacillus xerothermodurans]
MRNSKHTATISLAVMAAGFIGTLLIEGPPWVRFLQTGFEAGLVGGLADWFAVTALFRHPLGIPIPHTALLPNNRDKVAKAFISTIQNDLLSKQSITNKLAEIPLLPRLLSAVQEQLTVDSTKAAIAKACEFIIRQLPLDKLADYAEKEAARLIRELDMRQLLEKGLAQAYAKGYDEKTFDFALDMAERLVSKTEIRDRMGAMAAQALTHMKTNGLMQFAMNAFVGFFNEEKLGQLIQQFILSGIAGMRDRENPNRQAVLESLRGWLNEPEHRSGIAAELEGLKAQLAEEMQLRGKIMDLLVRLQEQAVKSVGQPLFVDTHVVPFVQRLIQRLENDPELLKRLETGLKEQIARLIEANHHRIGVLIKENIDRFDDETLIELMEDKIGSDLQWIRVNGAVCGFLIGLVLAGLESVLR